MNRNSIRQTCVEELEKFDDCVYGGRIARIVADIHLCKESNVERRLRELTEDDVILRDYVDNPKKRGGKVVVYKYKPKETLF